MVLVMKVSAHNGTRPSLRARLTAFLAGMLALAVPVQALAADDLELAFDRTLGTQSRAPRTYASPLEAQLAALSNATLGRIGVAAVDLTTGRSVSVLGDQPFPLASTSKIAVAAAYLEGVEQGRWSLTSEFPLLIPVKSDPFSTAAAPVRQGEHLPADKLIELMIARSSNPATDALLHVLGGPKAVNDWARRAGIKDFRIDRDIATLVRDDGAVDPATTIDPRDAATPLAMTRLLTGLYKGHFLSESSRSYLLGVMERTVTGTRRIRAGLPEDVRVAHKTGSLSNTSSDVGIIHLPDGRAVAVAIYVTGQGSRLNREARIAAIARTLYDGFQAQGQGMQLAKASR